MRMNDAAWKLVVFFIMLGIAFFVLWVTSFRELHDVFQQLKGDYTNAYNDLIRDYDRSVVIKEEDKYRDQKGTTIVFAAGYYNDADANEPIRNYVKPVSDIIRKFMDSGDNRHRYRVVVYGHADEKRYRRGNLYLSYERAVNVADALQRKTPSGLPDTFDDIYIKGFGEAMPIPDIKKTGKNRRVEIGIMMANDYLFSFIEEKLKNYLFFRFEGR